MKPVLIIEDDVTYRTLISEGLTQEGIEFLTASNGAEALEIVKKNSDISLIVLDLMMPHMDGLTFFYELKKILKINIPVIIVTNLSETAIPTDSDIQEFMVKANTSLPEIIQKIKYHREKAQK